MAFASVMIACVVACGAWWVGRQNRQEFPAEGNARRHGKVATHGSVTHACFRVIVGPRRGGNEDKGPRLACNPQVRLFTQAVGRGQHRQETERRDSEQSQQGRYPPAHG